MSCCNAHSNFVFESIALELVGHEFFREFHLNRHVCATKRYQRLVTNIAQILIFPHDLFGSRTRDELTGGGRNIFIVRKKLTTSYSRYDIASTNSSNHFRCVYRKCLGDLIKSIIFEQKLLNPKDYDKQRIIALKKSVSIFSAVDDDLFSQRSVN